MKWYQILLAAAVAVVSLAGQTLVKAGLNQVRQQAGAESVGLGALILRVLHNPVFLGGFATLVAGAITYMVLLYSTDISRALPLLGAVAYLLLFWAAYFFLHERITLTQCVGLVLLLAGMYLIAR